eukprot:TRINITY_DN9344_c0_g1_i1.p2 TRINITY_DN9344_c0_g1~~TRINITY_DN9344_c0_g1_i1.p2  ORF type:complete len:218 (+),score=27.70 TRINITY_DN9344_c0_g1_i1:138-791(+)
MDAAMNQVMEAAVLQAAQQIEDKLDDQLHQMENLGDADIDALRRQRLTQMKKQAEMKETWLQRGHGEVQHLVNEKEFFSVMKGEDKMVCHFFRENWPCKVMDKHLNILCKQHLECKFCRIDAEKSPYLTEKLKIWMLPTLALVKNEKVVEYVVGFDELGGRDDFKTETLAGRLAAADVLNYHAGDKVQDAAGTRSNIRKSEFVSRVRDEDEDSDFDQ